VVMYEDIQIAADSIVSDQRILDTLIRI
jgi:hypothetical protein